MASSNKPKQFENNIKEYLPSKVYLRTQPGRIVECKYFQRIVTNMSQLKESQVLEKMVTRTLIMSICTKMILKKMIITMKRTTVLVNICFELVQTKMGIKEIKEETIIQLTSLNIKEFTITMITRNFKMKKQVHILNSLTCAGG